MPKQVSGATLETEKSIFARGFTQIAGIDEVGRGSLAGPVSVGVAVVSAEHSLVIEGLIDSKALSAKVRQDMAPQIRGWAKTAVGHTQPGEIDVLGMTLALRLAAQRAMAQVVAAGARPDFVLLDGKHDWLTSPEPDLLGALDDKEQLYQQLLADAWKGRSPYDLPVQTVIKGDFICASIAAASVVAKVERDTLMDQLHTQYPQYEWNKNKGYGSSVHRASLDESGPTVLHRLSWNLGVTPEQLHTAHINRAKLGL